VDVLDKFKKRKFRFRHLGFQSKVVLRATVLLILAGAVIIFFAEYNGVLKGMTAVNKAMACFFQSVTARTAGFNTLPIGSMAPHTLLVLVFLMFIGASPGSTGGGIKTTTFVIYASAIRDMFFDRSRVSVASRSVPKRIMREALVIVTLSSLWVFVMTFIIQYSQGAYAGGGMTFIQVLFEVTSAFGTVGLSTGITAGLDTLSKLCIIVTMFAGRIGPLTLALAIAFRENRDYFVYPEERIMIG
jgi:Trk-type K+ transport systems, membrane components